MKRLFSFGCGVLLGVLAFKAHAQEMHIVDNLSFGVFAVSDNTTPQSIVVTPDNDTIADTGIAVGTDGQRGVYEFNDLPPNVNFFLGVEVPNPPSEGGIVFDETVNLSFGGQSFTVTDFTIANGGILQTDGTGNATLYLGATLLTSGNGMSYPGGIYTNDLEFTIYY